MSIIIISKKITTYLNTLITFKGYISASRTRQNPNGNRNGYECAEERDYYPYWYATIWKDIAILTSNTSLCHYFRDESFNMKSKFQCLEKYANGDWKHWSRWNNKNDCLNSGGQWTELSSFLEKAPRNFVFIETFIELIAFNFCLF